MRILQGTALSMIAVIISGCASTFDLEHNLNAQLGKVLDPRDAEKMTILQHINSTPMLYEYYSKKGACTVVLETNPETQVVINWRYKNGSKPCTLNEEYGHAW